MIDYTSSLFYFFFYAFLPSETLIAASLRWRSTRFTPRVSNYHSNLFWKPKLFFIHFFFPHYYINIYYFRRKIVLRQILSTRFFRVEWSGQIIHVLRRYDRGYNRIKWGFSLFTDEYLSKIIYIILKDNNLDKNVFIRIVSYPDGTFFIVPLSRPDQ